LGWAVAGVVFGAALGISIWQAGERDDLEKELAGTATELRQTQRRITRLSQSLERAVGRSVGLSRGINTCVGALDDQVDLFNALARELNAVRAFDQSQAESFHRRAQGLRRTANRSLGRCRGAGANA
jgi:chromosome segregation ATPase